MNAPDVKSRHHFQDKIFLDTLERIDKKQQNFV